MPRQPKKQTQKELPPPKRTTRPRRGDIAKHNKDSGGGPAKSNSAEAKKVATAHDGPENDTIADSNKNKLKEHRKLHTLSKRKASTRVDEGRPAKTTGAEAKKTVDGGPVKDTRVGNNKAVAKRAVGRPRKSTSAKSGRMNTEDDGPVKNISVGHDNKASAEILSGKRRRRPPPRWEVDKPAEEAEVAARVVVTRSSSRIRRNP